MIANYQVVRLVNSLAGLFLKAKQGSADSLSNESSYLIYYQQVGSLLLKELRPAYT